MKKKRKRREKGKTRPTHRATNKQTKIKTLKRKKRVCTGSKNFLEAQTKLNSSQRSVNFFEIQTNLKPSLVRTYKIPRPATNQPLPSNHPFDSPH